MGRYVPQRRRAPPAGIRRRASDCRSRSRFSTAAMPRTCIAIVRHELGVDATKRRFPTKATCLAIYSRVVNSEAALTEVLERGYPWCVPWEAELKKLFDAYVRREAGAERPRLRRPAAVLGAHGRRALAGAGRRRALRPRARRRVSGHQPAAGVDPAGDEAGRQGPHGRRRRRAIDLFVSRRDGPQHPRLPAAVRAARPRGDARPQLPLHASDPRCLQRRDRPRAGALHQESLDRPRRPRASRASSPSATKAIRRAASPSACSSSASGAWRSNRRRCCSAAPATARNWSSSSPGATFPS